MAKELTPRQQEIQTLLEQDKTPTEIGAALNISPNAVYQQLRRMHGKGGAKARAKRATTAKPAGNAADTTSQATVTASPKTELRDMTPLQAIRARRTFIEGEIKESSQRVEQTAKQLKAESESHARLTGKRRDELGQLVKAETALTGKPVVKTAKRKEVPAKPEGSNGSGDKSHLAAVPPTETPVPEDAPA